MIDKEKYHRSIDRLTAIYKSISLEVTEVSKYRCPYKNVKSNCTASFVCRNQKLKNKDALVFTCIGSDKLNYLDAWGNEQI